jgi:ABC-type Fe3+/spermidine/putrescine transport system ATPase subunit
MNLVTVSGIHKQGEQDLILKDITFSQRKLQKIAIAGETGSGKSTLLKIIAGLVQPDGGEVFFEDKKVSGPADTLVPGHPGIAYLSQTFELPKFLRVEQVLAYSNVMTAGEADTLYEVCQISHLLKRKTDQLSGGEKQRIALARLLITSPKLLLLDEPFSHLDMVHKNTLKAVIRDIGKRLKITCVLVSHDPADTLSWADKILVMKDGQIVQKGAPEKIYRQPVNEYTAGLFGKYNLITPAHAEIFSRLPGIAINKKSLIVRPEHFKIVPKGKRALSGKVMQVHFLGDHYELEVSIPRATSITVKAAADNFDVGDTIGIALSPEAVWPV